MSKEDDRLDEAALEMANISVQCFKENMPAILEKYNYKNLSKNHIRVVLHSLAISITGFVENSVDEEDQEEVVLAMAQEILDALGIEIEQDTNVGVDFIDAVEQKVFKR